VPGETCLFQIAPCYYDALGVCDCLYDYARSESYYSCSRATPDAAPVEAPDTVPDVWTTVSRMVPCSEDPTFDPTFSNCTATDAGTLTCGGCQIPAGVNIYSCLLEDGKSVCGCVHSKWVCGSSACPEDTREWDPCGEDFRMCMNRQGERCVCTHVAAEAGAPAMQFRCDSVSN
jgi:hypothetical protein